MGLQKILPRARDCMELLEKEMTQTAKMKRAAAGGKAPENKDYTIHKRFFRYKSVYTEQHAARGPTAHVQVHKGHGPALEADRRGRCRGVVYLVQLAG